MNKVQSGVSFLKENTLVVIIGVIVIIALLYQLGVWKESVVPVPVAIAQSAEQPTYQRVELQLSGEWSEKLFTLSDENRTVWEVPGLEARTDTKELVLYPPLGDGHLGAHRWVQFRFPGAGGGRVKTCSHPKGTTWEICK